MVSAAPVVHHRLAVELDPAAHTLAAVDQLVVPPGRGGFEFSLHAGLAPRVERGGRLVRLGAIAGDIPRERFRLEPLPGSATVTLRYGGVINHPLQAFGEGVGHGTETTPGLISAEGVVLDGASGWYPQFDALPRAAFELTVAVPAGWEAISQGARAVRDGRVSWSESSPQEEIYLVAGPLTRYSRPSDPAAMVYLRTPDPVLAQTYLDATERYTRLYSGLLGPYPYAKFALVENFWETGYGMPSFTLLGSRVIRLPFLLDSSYPHEILHNWWGNGVFVDSARGNWSEGLTAYLADHLLKEQAGRGVEYRRDQLQAYAAYASAARDFPLAQFGARHSGATQAIGYGKGMMFFHMLRRELGDERFVAGLRRFYGRMQFREARYDDLRADMEAVSGKDLGPFFRQWIERPGAPMLGLGEARFADAGVTITLEQSQLEAPYALKVPVVVGLADGRRIARQVEFTGRRTTANLKVPSPPVCVAVDPGFDLFRRVAAEELPVSLGAALGAERLLILLPSEAAGPMRDAYRQLAASWAASQAGVEVKSDDELQLLPDDRAVLLLGWENRHLGAVPDAPARNAKQVRLEQQLWARDHRSFVLVGRQRGRTVAWLGTDDPAALPALGCKVPHYGKFSYLVFDGTEAENKLKGQWPIEDSPLMRRVGEGSCLPVPEQSLAQ
jgi:hypothetical protein